MCEEAKPFSFIELFINVRDPADTVDVAENKPGEDTLTWNIVLSNSDVDLTIKLSSLLSDTTGAVATKLIDGIIAGRKDLDRLIAENYHGKLKASKELLKEALEGRVTTHHKFMLKQIKGNLAHLESQVEMIDKEMDNKLEEFNEQVTLL
jgi:hypothetical protein